MPTTYYYTVDDEIIGEHTLGQSRIDYLTDALGSVVQTVDQTLSTTSTTRYKPYGADLAVTGAKIFFGFTGNTGSRRTARPSAEQYNQSRHLSTTSAGWTTVDNLWPGESPYGYVDGMPTVFVDPAGTSGKHKFGKWLTRNADMASSCVSLSLGYPVCAGLDKDQLYKMMLCLIDAEVGDYSDRDAMLSDLNRKTHERYKGTLGGISNVGPCRYSGINVKDYKDQFFIPGWADTPCDNIKEGVQILCSLIKAMYGTKRVHYNHPTFWLQSDDKVYIPCMKSEAIRPRPRSTKRRL